MHEKEKVAKIKDSICNIPIEAANVCYVMPRPANWNKLIKVKLKQGLNYRGYVYFKPVHPNVV